RHSPPAPPPRPPPGFPPVPPPRTPAAGVPPRGAGAPPPPLFPPHFPQPTQRCPVGCPGRVIFRVRGCRPDGAQPRTAHQRNKPGHTAVRAASVRTEATLTHDVRRRPTRPPGPPRSPSGAERLHL